MKNLIFIQVFIFSISLLIIGFIYSKQAGFIIGQKINGNNYYSTELMSSGGDDFDIFQFNTRINILLAILSLFFLSINLFFKRTFQKLFLVLFFIFWGLELFIVFLISLDVSLLGSIINGDYLLLIWLILFFVEIPCIIISSRQKVKNTYNRE